MRYIADDFIHTAKLLGIYCKELSLSEAVKVRAGVETNFCRKGDNPLWERIITDESSRYLPGKKGVIGKLNNNEPIVVFFEQDTDSSVIEIESFNALAKVIMELFGFVFYITDEKNRYLLCWNDHEFLIGTGEAKNWVDEM